MLLMVLSVTALVCAGAGAFVAAISPRFRNGWLVAFGILYAVRIVPTDGGMLLFPGQVLDVYVGLGSIRGELGVNFLGVALLVWYGRLQRARSGPADEERAADAPATSPVPVVPEGL